MTSTTRPETGQNPPPATPLSLLGKVKKYFSRGGAALRHRNYRLFFFGQLISLIGTWMQNLAQSWLVLTISNNDPLALGVVSSLQFLPTMILALFTGVIADRYPKRIILLCTQTAAMILAAVLAVLATFGWVQLWQVYLMALLLGTVNALDMPTRQAFASEMVGREDLMNAVALNSTIFNGARVLGPALAGIMIGIGEKLLGSTMAGTAFAIWLNAASYIAVIFNLARMNPAELHSPVVAKDKGTMGQNLKEGLSFIWHTPRIRALILLVGTVGTFGINFNVWIPVLAREHLAAGAEGFGVLMAGLGVGALISAIGMAMGGREPDLRRILISVLGFGAFEVVVAMSNWYLVSLLAMVLTGLFMIRVNAASNTFIQTNSPDHLRGRVMSVYLLVFAGTTPIGSILIGWFSSTWGTPFSMAMGGMLSMLGVPLVLLVLRGQLALDEATSR